MAVIGIAHYYSHFFILLLPPLFPLIATDLEVGFIELGAILTGFAVASGVSQIPIGFLVDRLGARNILILGLILESLCFIVMGLEASYWTLFFAYVIAGIANGVYHPADYAILSASVRPERMGRRSASTLLAAISASRWRPSPSSCWPNSGLAPCLDIGRC